MPKSSPKRPILGGKGPLLIPPVYRGPAISSNRAQNKILKYIDCEIYDSSLQITNTSFPVSIKGFLFSFSSVHHEDGIFMVVAWQEE